MNVSVNLKSKDWIYSDSVIVKGFTFYNSQYYEKEKFSTLVIDIYQNEGIDKLLSVLNGRFSIIIKSEKDTFIIVDHIRSIPLFYECKNDNLTIYDQILIKDYTYKDADELGLESLLNSGYVINNLTIIKNIYQIRPASYLRIRNTIEEVEYFNYTPETLIPKTETEFEETLIQVFKDYVTSIQERQIVIPLSGGYDSRLVLLMFHKLGYKNIIAFTYGRNSFIEKHYAKNICDTLKIKWIDVDYDAIVEDDFIHNPAFIDYFDKGCNLSGMAYLQDYFAVRYIHSHTLVDKDAIFIPGHTGDFLSGRKLPVTLQKCDHTFIKKMILNEHLNFHKNSHKLINALDIKGTNWSCYENWIMKERQSKFIINSIYVFEYFGYDCFIPLWDIRLVSLFKSLPFNQKLFGKLYKDTCNKLFKEYDIQFKNELHPNRFQMYKQQFKNCLKMYLPKNITNLFIQKNDPYCYGVVINQMSKYYKFIEPLQSNNYNAYLVQWYVHLLKN